MQFFYFNLIFYILIKLGFVILPKMGNCIREHHLGKTEDGGKVESKQNSSKPMVQLRHRSSTSIEDRMEPINPYITVRYSHNYGEVH